MGEHWVNEPPLAPALKRYLTAFDRYLAAKTQAAERTARDEMLAALACAGIQSRSHLPRRNTRNYQDAPRRAA